MNHNSVHIASNTKLMIANCQSASVLQALIWNCEAVVHGLKARRVYEDNILLIRWLRIIDFDRSLFAARINHPAGNNGPHPTGPPARGQLAVSFSQAMLLGSTDSYLSESRNKHYRKQHISQSQCLLQCFNYRFCYARKNDNGVPARSECRTCFEAAALSPH